MTTKKPNTAVQLALLEQNIEYIKDKIDHIDQRMANDYVTKSELETLRTEFKLVQKIVYGLVSLILIAVIGALVRLVVA